MFVHDVVPGPETWADGSAQEYGWQHLVNSSGVYGAYHHIDIVARAIPTDMTRRRLQVIKEAIAAEGCIVLETGVIAAADAVVANAMKPDGKVCADQEVWDMGLNVGIYVLQPAVDLHTAA